MATKIKGLQMWCRKMTEGYSHVDISNFTTAWRNGMAFCAIIHRFRPDLIDYDSLSPENVFENNKLAFEVGESELNIPAFLEADDMARLKVPDKLSVITYVSQYYNYLSQLPQLGGPGVKADVKKGNVSGTKRPPDTTTKSSEPSSKKAVSSVSAKEDDKNAANTNTPNNTSSSPRKGTVGDKCAICHNKVYLLERHIDSGKLYHRSCFRHSDLSPTNKVYTKSPFMSPSLNNEKASMVTEKQPNKAHEDTLRTNTMNDKKGNESAVLAHLKSGLKRVEGSIGSKHSIQGDQDKDEEAAKKAKIQPKNLFGVKGSSNNVSSTEKKAEESAAPAAAFPLSGKEAKKLEKRRQEIISSESSSTPVNKGANKRGVPLIFQNKDKTESTTTSSTSTPSKSSSVSVVSSKTLHPVASKSEDSKTFTGAGNDMSKVNAVQKLQNTFSSQPASNKTQENSNTAQPVARQRVTGSKVASSPFMDKSTAKKDDSSQESVLARNKETKEHLPVAAPRKSMLENVLDKKMATEKNKNFITNASHLSAESSSSEDNSTPRSSHSKSSTSSSSSSSLPPALPLTPPPSLPNSGPPSLPSSAPPPVPSSSSISSKHNNHQSSSSSSSLSTDSSNIKLPKQSLVKDKKHLSESSEHSSKHNVPKKSPSPSPTPPSRPPPPSTAVAKASPSVSPTPTPTPTPTQPNPTPTATLVTPTEKKNEGKVLSGLLTSLAGVRNRSASTPNDATTIVQPATNTKDTSFDSPTPKTTGKHPPTSSTTAFLNVTTTTANRKHSEPAISSSAGNFSVPKSPRDKRAANQKTIQNSSHQSSKSDSNEVTNVLNSLKPVSNTTTSTKDLPNNSSKLDKKEESKSNTGKDQNKVGSLVKNYLSKSKDDISSAGCHDTKEAVQSQSDDVFKKPQKPLRPQEQPKIENAISAQTIVLKSVSKSKENLNEIENIQSPANSTKSNFKDIQLKKVGLPPEPNMENNISISANHKKDEDKKKEISSASDSDVPQWKKDIEERKKKLREDIVRSEAPTKRNEKPDKEKLNAKNETPSKKSMPPEQPKLDVSKPEKVSPRNNDTEMSSKGDKLNWQVEAERRIAAFAFFDDNDEIKSPISETAQEEDTFTSVNDKKAEQKDKNVGKPKTKLIDNELIKQKITLKPVNIDISIDNVTTKHSSEPKANKKVEITKPLSLNNNNNLSVRTEEKDANDVSVKVDTKDKTKEKGLLSANKDSDKGKQPSPKVKRKISLFGKKNKEEPSITPAITPDLPSKKKISVRGNFDFDADSISNPPSDFESSLNRSTEQLTISDEHQTPGSPRRPPRTKSQRNKVVSPKQISAIELQQQLLEIDNRLTDLELRGRDLEDSIRNASFQEGSSEASSLDEDADDRLMMEWFQLVSDKNDLVRQEADLVYLSREQELESDQEHIDSQLRYLIGKDDVTKSPQEKEEESYLLQRKLDIVNQRNSIIDSMDEDRLRYEEEDKGIENVLQSKGYRKMDGEILAEKGKKVAQSTFYT